MCGRRNIWWFWSIPFRCKRKIWWLFVAGATFGDIAASLFVAGATFGDVAASRNMWCWSVTFCGRCRIWWCWTVTCFAPLVTTSHLTTCHYITSIHLTTPHHMTLFHTSPPPTHHGNPTSNHQSATTRPNARRLVHTKTSVWASHWLVPLRTFYRQILSLVHSFFPFWNFRPRLARLYLYYSCLSSIRILRPVQSSIVLQS